MTRPPEAPESLLQSGVGRRFAAWMELPRGAPSIPFVAAQGPEQRAESVRQAHPDPAYLRYMNLWRRLVLLPLIAIVIAAWLLVFFAGDRVVALWLLPVAIALVLIPGALTWISLRLRYDTTWYVFTDRSLRMRRGVWITREITITFENVQNVSIAQGPIERVFGIKRLTIETAGGGSGTHGGGNACVLEGLTDADALRDEIMARVRRSRSTGLGDEHESDASAGRRAGALSSAQMQALRSIRDEARALAGAVGSG